MATESTMQRSLNRLVPAAAVAMLIVALVAVNVLAAFVPVRVDVTGEGLYTLSKGTREILSGLENPVTLKLYYSRDVPDLPVQFKTYSTKVVELLEEYEAAAPGNRVRLETYNPEPDTEDEEWATRYGLSPAQLPNGTRLYFGLVAVSADREATVPFFDPRRERFLEYDISEAIARVQRADRPRIGVLSYLPLGGFGGAPMRQQRQGEWAVMRELQKSFEVETLRADKLVKIPAEIDLVLVVHPKLMPNRISYALDQFVLRGGKLVALVDPNSRLDQSPQAQAGRPMNSSLDDLFAAWGVKYDKLRIVGDRELATRVNSPQQGVIDYPVWVTVTPEYISEDSVITSELEEMMFVDAGRFQPAEDFPLTFTPLVTSSPNSGMLDFTTVRVTNPGTISRMVEPDDERKTLVALITGRFPAAFPGGPPEVTLENEQDEETLEQLRQRAETHLGEAQAETSVLLVGDADFIADRFSVQRVSFFGNAVTQPVNDNLNLVLNAAEYLAGSQALIHIRSRGKFSRPFTRVQDLQQDAAERYLAEEQRLSDKLDEVKSKLNQIEQQRPQGEDLMLSQDQLEAVRQYRLEEQRTRQALRDVRKVLRQDIERLGNTLLAVNLLAMPLVVAGLGFVIIFRRTRRSRGGK